MTTVCTTESMSKLNVHGRRAHAARLVVAQNQGEVVRDLDNDRLSDLYWLAVL